MKQPNVILTIGPGLLHAWLAAVDGVCTWAKKDGRKLYIRNGDHCHEVYEQVEIPDYIPLPITLAPLL